MNHQSYNGWSSYETWLIALWIDNEESSQTFWRDEALDIYRRSKSEGGLSKRENALIAISYALKEAYEETVCETAGEAGFVTDLLASALSKIDWYEVAKHLRDEAGENE